MLRVFCEINAIVKRKAVIFCIFIGITLLVVSVNVIIWRRAKTSVYQASTVADSLMYDMATHRYQAASDLFIPQLRAEASAAKLSALEILVEKRYGAYINHGLPQWNVENKNGHGWINLRYLGKFSGGHSEILIILVKTRDRYQVYYCHYQL